MGDEASLQLLSPGRFRREIRLQSWAADSHGRFRPVIYNLEKLLLPRHELLTFLLARFCVGHRAPGAALGLAGGSRYRTWRPLAALVLVRG